MVVWVGKIEHFKQGWLVVNIVVWICCKSVDYFLKVMWCKFLYGGGVTSLFFNLCVMVVVFEAKVKVRLV